MDKVLKGLEVTGMYPINLNLFSDDDSISEPIIEELMSRNETSFNNDIASEVVSTKHVTNESKVIDSSIKIKRNNTHKF